MEELRHGVDPAEEGRRLGVVDFGGLVFCGGASAVDEAGAVLEVGDVMSDVVVMVGGGGVGGIDNLRE